jgi:hypothetical protein
VKNILFIDFPIIGIHRLPLLLMELIFIITSMEIGFIFIIRYSKLDKELRNIQELGYASLFLGFSIMWLFYIVSDYYSPNDVVTPFLTWNQGSVRALFLNFGYFSMIIGGFFFFYCIEKYKVLLIKRYLISFILLIIGLLFIILFFIDILLTQTLANIVMPSFLVFFLKYMIEFIRKVRVKEKILILSGFLFLIFGFFGTTDIIVSSVGVQVRIIGAIFQLISIIFLSKFFITLPPFSEFDWQEKIEELFIINRGGICLYSRDFIKKTVYDENLTSAAISGVNSILQKLMDAKGISVIKKKGQIVIIYPGNHVSGVLFSSEDLNMAKLFLKELVEKFETIYSNILKDWGGDISIFEPVDKIVKDMFF